MRVGDRAQVSRRFASADIAAWARLAGAEAPPDAVPEPLLGALFSYLLGVELPGFGTNWLKQDLRFLAPAPLEETLTATVEVTRLRPEKHLVDLACRCDRADGTPVCEGRALVLARDVGAG